MSLSTFLKLVNKAFKFTVSRPLQRFNIENRAVRYLGPDSKKFVRSPRAIGAISGLKLKELPKYPQIAPGYRSISQRRRDAIEGEEGQTSAVPRLKKSYSEDKADDNFVLEAARNLDVIKTIARLAPPPAQIESGANTGSDTSGESSSGIHRPLPKSTSLPLQNIRSMWEVKRTPPGRMDLNMLQELMINKLADEAYWTPKAIADRYNIREVYAEKLTSYMKQIRIRISPRMARNMDYVGMNNPEYLAAKHIIFHVDKSLRSDFDRKYDSMYLPNEDLPDEVRELIDAPGSLVAPPEPNWKTQLAPQLPLLRRVARPKPLRIAPLNQQTADGPSQQQQSQIEQEDRKKLEAPRRFSQKD